MKVLVDMNLSPAWVSFLTGEGIEAVHWATVGDPRAPDRELMDWARERGYVVFTHDLDFGTLLALAGMTGPSVLQVRVLDLLPSAIGADVLRVLGQHAEELEHGALVTLDGSTTRVRVLPVRRSGERPG
jgi:predicted nuclease of predicted toxin-antitoxin system